MRHLILFITLFLCLPVFGQEIKSEIGKFSSVIQALDIFSKKIPQEKVYLHFDNTSYYQGDKIWFKCYIVTSERHQLSWLSKTLYVELLNPGGEIVDKRILRIEDGQCHGDFTLNQLPFYSGFYEVRAYTKYMLNFGDDTIFSRLLPVFNKPKAEGNFEEKDMLRYGRWGTGDYPMKRERPIKEKAVNLRFFPEGGYLIQGVTSRIAFEATDEVGNPIDVKGVVIDGNKQELCSLATFHDGRGLFTYTPNAGRRRDIAHIEFSGKKYSFDLPMAISQGVAMQVDNHIHPDSVGITLRKNVDTPAQMVGVAMLNGGKLQHLYFSWIEEDEIFFKMEKTRLPSGVSQIVLFNCNGQVLCDRLIFTNKNDFLEISATTGKQAYRPFELVDMELSITDKESNPMNTTFSLSVRDGANEVENKRNILTDLLLMSEIKGYVHNPSYYFEADDDVRRIALDHLLMVQGWRRYSWQQMTGIKPFELKYPAEQGLETNGKIVSLVRQKPQPNVDVGLLLFQIGADEAHSASYMGTFVTDEQGRFSFISDVDGRWNMILTVTEKGKKRDHWILLDRVFTPEPGRYRYADLQITIAENNNQDLDDEEIPHDLKQSIDSLFFAYQDSLSKLPINRKVLQIPEVKVRAKKRTQAQDILHNRSTSLAFYDVPSELDDIYDRGIFVGKDIHAVLKNMNKNFYTISRGDREWILYKNRMPLFVIDYERAEHTRLGYFKYQNINLNAIKAIYINETAAAKCQYADSRISCFDADDVYGCVVFIETYPEGQIPVEGAKGVRKTWLEGYSTVSEFYSPDYAVLPPMPDDYRSTIYWNPMVTTDENGKAKVTFYNNSRCTQFSISAETVTSFGMIGVY